MSVMTYDILRTDSRSCQCPLEGQYHSNGGRHWLCQKSSLTYGNRAVMDTPDLQQRKRRCDAGSEMSDISPNTIVLSGSMELSRMFQVDHYVSCRHLRRLGSNPVHRNSPWCNHNWVCSFTDKRRNLCAASITVASQVSDLSLKYWN